MAAQLAASQEGLSSVSKYMDLTLREGVVIKFGTKLRALMCHYNYYALFYYPSCELVQ
jgi:hypothetical protein